MTSLSFTKATADSGYGQIYNLMMSYLWSSNTENY